MNKRIAIASALAATVAAPTLALAAGPAPGVLSLDHLIDRYFTEED